MTSFIPAIILVVTVLAALINGVLDGNQSLSLVLWTMAGVTLVVVLARAYLIGAEIDRLASANQRHTVRAHILFHIIPLTYFPLAYAMEPGKALEVIYLIPVILFFVTGVRTWKLCYGLFGTKLYKIFQIGNRQMLFLFPAAVALDISGWLAGSTELFFRLMHVYFIIHLMLTGITVPLLARDLRRYVTGAPEPVNVEGTH